MILAADSPGARSTAVDVSAAPLAEAEAAVERAGCANVAPEPDGVCCHTFFEAVARAPARG